MKRHEFLGIILGGAAACSGSASAQPRPRLRRIGVLMHLASDDPAAMTRIAAFLQGLEELGWHVGRNIQIDYRWAVGDVDLYRKYAAELVALAPDVLVTTTTQVVRALQQATRTIPIVFSSVIDAVGSGLIGDFAKPSGNATGFTLFEYGISGKWLEFLKQIAPTVTRVAVLRDSASTTGVGQFAAMQTAAATLAVTLHPLDVQDVGEIERGIGEFAARNANGGLIVTSSPLALIHRTLIATLAARHRLPAVYPFGLFTSAGGLMSYGPDLNDPHRRAAGYVSRILKGDKVSDLSVQAPTSYQLSINLPTARTLGIAVPDALAARADELIE